MRKTNRPNRSPQRLLTTKKYPPEKNGRIFFYDVFLPDVRKIRFFRHVAADDRARPPEPPEAQFVPDTESRARRSNSCVIEMPPFK